MINIHVQYIPLFNVNIVKWHSNYDLRSLICPLIYHHRSEHLTLKPFAYYHDAILEDKIMSSTIRITWQQEQTFKTMKLFIQIFLIIRCCNLILL